MSRIARLLITDQQTVYHVINRTALEGFPLKNAEKDFLVTVFKQLSRLYFVEIIGFCVMGDHFHLLVRMLPESKFSDQDLKKRFRSYFGKEKTPTDNQLSFVREKYASLPEFIKEIKMAFSRFYNRRHQRRGFFWGDRFKSVIVEEGRALVNCLAYIDLNPVRAGLVKKPDSYRWCSLGYHVKTGNKGKFLSLNFGLKAHRRLRVAERLNFYRRFVYNAGALSKAKKSKNAAKENTEILPVPDSYRFTQRTRYFTDSGVIGSKEFVRENFLRFKHLFQTKTDRLPKRIKGLEGVYSLKRLTEDKELSIRPK